MTWCKNMNETKEELPKDFGLLLPKIIASPPGPLSRDFITRLAATECPAITARRARRQHETGVNQDPIVWTHALGANIRDADGNIYVDLSAAFAVSGLGHRHPKVVQAAHLQVDRMIHAMGDVFPSDVKIEFSERLAQFAPGDLQESILGLSGADAIGAALKTAAIHTGKSGVIAFWNGYHGLGHGALSVTAYRKSFREPFLSQLGRDVFHVPYPNPARPPFGLQGATPETIRDAVLTHIRSMLSEPATGAEGIGAIIIEPILGRGGEVVPPDGFLQGLREIADEFGLVLIFDEIFTGFGRTGKTFACEWEGVLPDILCVGKALGGGFPLSAAIGRPHIMRSWGTSSGESVHTSTFLGNPLGCAMGLAFLEEFEEGGWANRAQKLGEIMYQDLSTLRSPSISDIRGRGAMLGVEFIKSDGSPDGARGLQICAELLAKGYICLPSGAWGHVLGLSPPFVLSEEQWKSFFHTLQNCIEKADLSR